MRLYYAETLMPRKVCALARHLGAPVTLVHVDLGKGEHRAAEHIARNPNGKVPVLVDGARTIWESNAILCHLAQRAASPLWPKDSAGQVELVRWFSWDSEHFTRAGGELYFQFLIRPRFGLGDPDPAAVADAQAAWRAAAGVLETHLEGRTWLLGDRLTVADFAIGVALPYADAARIPLSEFPRITAWHERLCALPGWTDPFPTLSEAA
ncbi:glutathione S-transferase family protein [Elioraea rosea]|uniref:glutathione S-transferase family protein n=1 Tax=Elioraea rosea TaxID=2492390 RepID=UPI0011830332|nr:glutathione S-transferase family protein [Elioraea rosea]